MKRLKLFKLNFSFEFKQYLIDFHFVYKKKLKEYLKRIVVVFKNK